MVRILVLVPPFCVLLALGLLAKDGPLPDRETLYKMVRENLAKSERVAYLYTYKEHRTDVDINPFGRVGTGGTRVFEVYPSPNPELTYRRLVVRDGAPLDERDVAEQDREYEVRVTDVQQRLAKRSDEERQRREDDAATDRRRSQTMIEDVVDTLQFKLEGRTEHSGVTAIVVSFAPRPGAQAKTREGRMAQKFAGTVWIHEAASEVMHVEATSIKSISFGLGLVARLNEGVMATVTRQPVEGGVWMPVAVTMSGRGRAALVRRFVLNHVARWLDYRRLPGDSVAPFLENTQIPGPQFQ